MAPLAYPEPHSCEFCQKLAIDKGLVGRLADGSDPGDSTARVKWWLQSASGGEYEPRKLRPSNVLIFDFTLAEARHAVTKGCHLFDTTFSFVLAHTDNEGQPFFLEFCSRIRTKSTSVVTLPMIANMRRLRRSWLYVSSSQLLLSFVPYK
jgi:hypothetical protein